MENKCNIQNGQPTSVPDILENAHLKANPFTAPKGYFLQVEERLQNAIRPTEKEVSPTLSSLRTSLAMVAMFALVFGLAYGVFSITNTGNRPATEQSYQTPGSLATKSTETDQETLSDEELLQHYGSYDAYSAETLETINVVPHVVNQEEIEQYLIDCNAPSFMVLAALE